MFGAIKMTPQFKSRAWEIYKILIQQNATFAQNQTYCKELVGISVDIANSFDSEFNKIDDVLSSRKKEAIK